MYTQKILMPLWLRQTFVFLIVCMLPQIRLYANEFDSTTMLAASSQTLKQATIKTLNQNPQLYRFSFVQQSKESLKSLNALKPPLHVEFELENIAGSGEFKGSNAFEATVALSSVIEMSEKRQARVSIADAQINRVRWEREAETLDVLGSMTATYIQTLATQHRIEMAKASLLLAQSLLNIVKKRSQHGAASEAEILRSKAAVAMAEIDLNGLHQLYERQKISLARYWGETKPKFSHLEGDLLNFGSDVDFEQLRARAQTSPGILIYASEARLKQAELRLARSNNKSNISWRAGVKQLNETGDSAFTASISMPLFSGTRNTGRVNSAIAEIHATDLFQKDARLKIHEQLFHAWSLRKQNIASAKKIQNIIIPSLEQSLTLAEEAYLNGRQRFQDLIAAKEELLVAKQTLIDSAESALLNQAIIEQLSSESLTPNH